MSKNSHINFGSNLEKVEIKAWSDLYRNASQSAIDACGIGFFEVESAFGGAARNVDILAFNRVVGLGVDGPVHDAILDYFIGEYEDSNIPRFFVQLPPFAINEEVTSLLRHKGLYHYNNWVKLYRPVEPLPGVKSILGAKRIDSSNADIFGKILTESFEWPDTLGDLIAGAVSRPHWYYYIAYAGYRPVATAAMYISGEYAWIDMASTLSEYRGRGAQTKLVEQRINDAAAAGCKWLVVETAEEKPGKPAPSFRNMRRLGFEIAYIRPNYIYE